MSFTKIFLLPRNAIGHVCQLNPYFIISSFFSPREQSLQQSGYNLNNFYDSYCDDCDLRNKWDEDEEDYTGECESGVSVLKAGNCERFSLSDFGSNEPVKITTLPYYFQTHISHRDGTIRTGHVNMYLYDPVELEKGIVKNLPYMMGNVHSGGNICWGHALDRMNGNLFTPRLLHSAFWESVFNSDLIPNSDRLKEWHEHLTVDKIIKNSRGWQNVNREVKGKLFIGTNDKVEGLFFSNQAVVVRKFKKVLSYQESSNELGRTYKGVMGWLKRGEYRLTAKAKVKFNGFYVEVGEDTFLWNPDANTVGKRVFVGDSTELEPELQLQTLVSAGTPTTASIVSPNLTTTTTGTISTTVQVSQHPTPTTVDVLKQRYPEGYAPLEQSSEVVESVNALETLRELYDEIVREEIAKQRSIKV